MGSQWWERRFQSVRAYQQMSQSHWHLLVALDPGSSQAHSRFGDETVPGSKGRESKLSGGSKREGLADW